MSDQAHQLSMRSRPETRESLQKVVLHMQAALGERMEQVRETLRNSEQNLSRLHAYEAKIAALEAELQATRQSVKDFEIQARKLEEENEALRTRMRPLEKEKHAAEEQAKRMRTATQRLQKTIGLEIGQVVRALLPSVRLSPLKRPSLAEKAALLVDGGIVDPAWYLQQYPDVAAAGMEAAVHYALHGAEEGRLPKPGLEGDAKKA